MEPRIDYEKKQPPGSFQAMAALDGYLRKSGFDPKLYHLIKIRASQINGCAYCIDMHTKDARADGETEQRIYELCAWHETPFFSDRERAALEWTEAVTLISESHAPDDVYKRVRQHFNETEFMNLTLAIIEINSWNRLAISFRAVPGTYQVKQQPVMAAH